MLLLGGLRPVVKGLNGDQVNQINSAILELLQGQGGALSQLLSETGTFSQTLADRYQVISEVIHNLNAVLGTVDEKSAQFDASVDQLQKLVSWAGAGPGPDRRSHSAAGVRGSGSDRHAGELTAAAAGRAREPSPTGHRARQPQGLRSTGSSNRSPRTTCGSTPLAPMGRTSTITSATVTLKFNGPAGSDVFLPMGGVPDPSKGRCSENG